MVTYFHSTQRREENFAAKEPGLLKSKNQNAKILHGVLLGNSWEFSCLAIGGWVPKNFPVGRSLHCFKRLKKQNTDYKKRKKIVHRSMRVGVRGIFLLLLVATQLGGALSYCFISSVLLGTRVW